MFYTSKQNEALWRTLWVQALANMPVMSISKNPAYPEFSKKPTYRRGDCTALRMCLGYHIYTSEGHNNASQCVYVAIKRGSKPRGLERQRMLAMLAGQHGPVIARAKLIQLGQADRFKIWPK